MPRSGPISLSLPAFTGVTRKLILANVGAFFALAILHWLAPGLADTLRYHLLLEPRAVLHGELWQLFTYSFINEGILGILFGMLTLWFVGSLLESSCGSQWLLELYAASVIGGAFLASALSFTHLLGLRPVTAIGAEVSGRLLAAGSSAHRRYLARHRHALLEKREQEFLCTSSLVCSPASRTESTWLQFANLHPHCPRHPAQATEMGRQHFGALLPAHRERHLSRLSAGDVKFSSTPRPAFQEAACSAFSETFYVCPGVRNGYYRWKL